MAPVSTFYFCPCNHSRWVETIHPFWCFRKGTNLIIGTWKEFFITNKFVNILNRFLRIWLLKPQKSNDMAIFSFSQKCMWHITRRFLRWWLYIYAVKHFMTYRYIFFVQPVLSNVFIDLLNEHCFISRLHYSYVNLDAAIKILFWKKITRVTPAVTFI
jgi:hypothetical protein